MTTKKQPSIVEIELFVESMAKRDMYKVTVLAVLLLIVILMAMGFRLLIQVMKFGEVT